MNCVKFSETLQWGNFVGVFWRFSWGIFNYYHRRILHFLLSETYSFERWISGTRPVTFLRWHQVAGLVWLGPILISLRYSGLVWFGVFGVVVHLERMGGWEGVLRSLFWGVDSLGCSPYPGGLSDWMDRDRFAGYLRT